MGLMQRLAAWFCAPGDDAGLDLMDVSYRVRGDFAVSVTEADWNALVYSHDPPDFTLGELHALIVAKRQQAGLPRLFSSGSRLKIMLVHAIGERPCVFRRDEFWLRNLRLL